MVGEIQKRKWNQSITFKITISVLGPFLFMGTAFMIILVSGIGYWHFQTEKASIDRFMSGYSTTLRNAFDLSDFDYIKISLKEIAKMTEMLNIGLFAADGSTVASLLPHESYFEKDAKEVAHALLDWPRNDYVKTFKYKSRTSGTILRNITILPNRESCLKCHTPDKPLLGFLMADFSTKAVSRHIYVHIFLVILATVVSILVMITVLNLVLKKMIKQPLEEINTGLKGIAVISGELKQIEHSSEDEIGSLVDALNSLAERHRYMQQELTSFYRGSYDPVSPLDYEMNILASTKVAQVIEKDIEVMYDNMTLKNVLALMKISAHTFFPVLNEWGQYEGVITLQDVRSVLLEPSKAYALLAKDFCQADAPVLAPIDSLKKAMDLFNASGVPYISVAEKDSGLFLGILARRKVLEILKQGFLKSVGI